MFNKQYQLAHSSIVKIVQYPSLSEHERAALCSLGVCEVTTLFHLRSQESIHTAGLQAIKLVGHGNDRPLMMGIEAHFLAI